MKDIFLLDMDETLLDFPLAERVNFAETLAAYGIEGEGLYARFHRINDDLWQLLERGGITREALKAERFRLLFAEFGIDADPAAVSVAYYDHFAEVCYPYEGARAFVETLSRRGRVYIVTNGGTKIQRRHIELAGFGPFLSGVFISEEMGVDKPSAEYAEAVKAAIPDFAESRAVWIGDRLTSDMVCAERAGVDFILFARRAPRGYTGAIASSYADILDRLDK